MRSKDAKKVANACSCIIISLCIAFAPINLDIKYGNIEVNENKANAVVPVVAGSALLAEMAAAAGLTTAEFVATIAGITTVSTGVVFASQSGISMSNSLSSNLDNLLDAADYMPWENLDSSEQEFWGSKENYQAAKFNSLMDAFGLGNARDRFYGSGGGSFDFTSGEIEILDKLGRIGANWKTRAGNAYSDIQDVLTQGSNDVFGQYIGVGASGLFDSTGIENYPTGYPTQLMIYKSGSVSLTTIDGRTYTYNKFDSVPETYVALIFTNNTFNNGYSYKGFSLLRINFDSYMYGNNSSNQPDPNVTVNLNAGTGSVDNINYYYSYNPIQTTFFTNYESSIQPNIGSWTETQIRNAVPYIVSSGVLGRIGAMPVNVVDYPETIPSTQQIYFPQDGLTPDMLFSAFTTALQTTNDRIDYIIQLMKRLGFNNSGELLVHDQGVIDSIEDLENIMQSIQTLLLGWFAMDQASDIIGDFDFDNVAANVPGLERSLSNKMPFGFLVMFGSLVTTISDSDNLQSPQMSVPFEFGNTASLGLDVDLDFSWLDGLKPYINFGCIMLLIMGLVVASIRMIELEASS